MTNDFKITEYDEFKAQMGELKDMANFIPDASTEEGYTKSKRIHLDFRKIENSLDKVRKDKKAYFLEGGRQVDSQAKEIMKQIEALRVPHTEAYQLVDTLKKEREAKRKQDLEDRVQYIRELPESLSDSCSDEIKQAMEAMQAEECDTFYEYTEAALKARNATRSALAKMFDAALTKEREVAELAKLRKEAEERARIDREEQIKREASEAAEKEKQAAIEREKAAKEAEAKAKQDAIDAEERRKREAKEAEARRVEAEKAAKVAADKAAEEARKAELKRQEEEAKRIEAEKAAREADTNHRKAINNEIKDTLIQTGISEEQAKTIVKAIASKMVPHVSINY